LEALQRHDLADWSCVNKEIRIFKRLLVKRLRSYKHVSIRSVNLGKEHFTRHGLHINYKGKKEICHQIADLVQRKLGTGVNICPVNHTPLKYRKDTVHDETIPLEYKKTLSTRRL
jgi:hypothetical protein